MSGILAAFASVRGPVATWTGDITSLNPGSATGRINVLTDGTLTGVAYSGQGKWYDPSGGTPGNSYYVKFTTSGSAWDSGLVAGTVYAITSTRTVTWTVTTQHKTGTLTVGIYGDAGGTSLLGTGTVTYDVDGSG